MPDERSALEPTRQEKGAEVWKLVSQRDELFGWDGHTPSVFICRVGAMNIINISHVVYNCVYSQQDLIVAEEGPFRQVNDVKSKEGVAQSDWVFKVKVQVIELLACLNNRRVVQEDLALKEGQHLPDEHLICKVLALNIVEEVEELVIVFV